MEWQFLSSLHAGPEKRMLLIFFSNIKIVLNFWNKTHLVVVSYILYILLNMIDRISVVATCIFVLLTYLDLIQINELIQLRPVHKIII